jgi:xanthine dehydrogenase molybdopterin-binding subunit B
MASVRVKIAGLVAPRRGNPHGGRLLFIKTARCREVDAETGAVALVRHTAIDDCGRTVNPMIVHGQIHGGIAQGVGQALVEDCCYDPGSGQLLAGSFMVHDEQIGITTELLGSGRCPARF